MTPDQEAAIRTVAEQLQNIVLGSEPTGRWLDASGTECDEDEDGARWEEYTAEEQTIWLESVVSEAETARRLLQKAFPNLTTAAGARR